MNNLGDYHSQPINDPPRRLWWLLALALLTLLVLGMVLVAAWNEDWSMAIRIAGGLP